MGFKKIEQLERAEADEDIVAEVESSWAAWHIASLAAVLAVIMISAVSLLRAG